MKIDRSGRSASLVPDEKLVQLLQDNDTSELAYGILIDRYGQKLYQVIRKIVLFHEDADDVLQNTFIKVWQNIASFKGDSKLSTWMYSIATNEALSHLRRERNNRKLPMETSEYDLSQILTGDPFFDGDEAEAMLVAAIEELPEKQKLTFKLRYYDNLPYDEIAEITGTSVGALKANYYHAVKKLQKYLKIDD